MRHSCLKRLKTRDTLVKRDRTLPAFLKRSLFLKHLKYDDTRLQNKIGMNLGNKVLLPLICARAGPAGCLRSLRQALELGD